MPPKNKQGPKGGKKLARPKKALAIKGGSKGFTPAQRIFVAEYLIDLDAARAYLVAYPHNAHWSRNKLLGAGSGMTQMPHIKEAIARGIAKKEAVAAFKSDEVLQHLQTGVFLDPRPWFSPGNIREETWKISVTDYNDLPVEIVRLIRFAEHETEYVVDPNSEEGLMIQRPTGMMLVQLVSKELLLGLLAKHMLGEKLAVSSTSVQINWGDMRAPTTVSMQQLKGGSDPIQEEMRRAIEDQLPREQLPPALDPISNPAPISTDLASSPLHPSDDASLHALDISEPRPQPEQPKQVILSNLPLADTDEPS